MLDGPHSSRRWQATIAAHATLAAPSVEGPVVVRGYLRKPSGTLMKKFRREVRPEALAPTGDGAVELDVAVPVRLKPGPYELNVVVAPPGADTPLALSVDASVPAAGSTHSTESMRLP